MLSYCGYNPSKIKNIMTNSAEVMKHTSSKLILTPAIQVAKSTVIKLKSQLDRDRPDLTIVDVRDSEVFNQAHIPGAVSIPFDRLPDLAKSALHRHRHLYIYGESEDRSLAAAKILHRVGFINVTQIIGGLSAWIEATITTESTS
jgi:rhodanese-related sulfurtransferase